MAGMSDSEARQISDSRVLAALAHPLRRRLMDLLHVYGPGTASGFAARTGQTVANVSHHLRVLAASGLIEDAPELAATRRERWWRLVSPALRWSTSDFAGDRGSAAVAEAAQSLNLDHHVAQVRTWFAADDEARAPWREKAFTTDKWLRLSPAELGELNDEIVEVVNRWAARGDGEGGGNEAGDDGPARTPVFFFAYGLPGTP
jgi:DNA-binding transcriptional ArsR family regulator